MTVAFTVRTSSSSNLEFAVELMRASRCIARPSHFKRGRSLGPAAAHSWCPRRDSNPEPTDYESAALTVELQGQNREPETVNYEPKNGKCLAHVWECREILAEIDERFHETVFCTVKQTVSLRWLRSFQG